MKQGKLQEISLSTQYYLEIEDNTLASINGNLVQGHVRGKTSVILRDRNVANNRELDNDSPKVPSPRASLTIAQASKMTLNLLPHYNWYTVVGERHEIAIDLYTQ